MNKKTVAVVFGGQVNRANSCEAASSVIERLSVDKYEVIPLFLNDELHSFMYDGPAENIKNIAWERVGTSAILSPDPRHHGLLRIVGDKLRPLRLDAVFPVFTGGCIAGKIQSICELAGLPFVGASQAAYSVFNNPIFMKKYISSLKINTLEQLTISGNEIFEHKQEILKNVRYKIGYPCLVQVFSPDASFVCGERAVLDRLLEDLAGQRPFPAITIQKHAENRIYSCAVLSSGSELITSFGCEPEIGEKIREASVKIAKSILGKGYGVAHFYFESERPVFIAFETSPLLTAAGDFFSLLSCTGIEMSRALDIMIQTSAK